MTGGPEEAAESREAQERRFSVQEANEQIPWLRGVLPRIRASRQVVLAQGERVRRSARGNGGGERGRELWEALETLRRDVEEITARGIILRDPETGLVDFPAVHGGRDVLLCWRLGEDEVGFWHSPGSGFAGRRPL